MSLHDVTIISAEVPRERVVLPGKPIWTRYTAANGDLTVTWTSTLRHTTGTAVKVSVEVES